MGLVIELVFRADFERLAGLDFSPEEWGEGATCGCDRRQRRYTVRLV